MAGVDFIVYEDEGDGIGSVRRVRTAGRGIDEHLGVAVIGGDEERSATLFDGPIDAA